MKPWFVIAIIVACSTSYTEGLSAVPIEKSRNSVSFSLNAGNAQGKALQSDSYIIIASLRLIEPPLGYEFLAIGMGNLLSMDDRVQIGSVNIVLNAVPIRTRYFRSSIGIGGGFAAVHEVIQGEMIDSTGSQIVAQGSLTFFSSSLRVTLKTLWIKTLFVARDVPILQEHQDVGSGLYYVGGLTFEIPL